MREGNDARSRVLTRPHARAAALASAAAVLALLAFGLIELTLRRPAAITDDLHGWRQAETQTIARNLAFAETDILRPRVDWGGDAPGYVDTELQLYPWLAALGMRQFGEAEWIGQVLSLALMTAGGWILFRALRTRFGALPALLALVLVLAGRGWFFLATAIQPEPLTFLAYLIGFLAFLRFVEEERRRDLVLACLATAVCGLVKPPALQLLIVQLTLVLTTKRTLLRRVDLWLGWAATLLVVVAFFAGLPALDPEHGNSFGIVGGGASLFPRLGELPPLATLLGLARMTVQWGTGVPAAAAAVFLLWKRQLLREESALAAGALVMGLASAHLTSQMSASYFHVLSSILGAWLLARAARLLLAEDARRSARALTALFVAAFALQALFTWRTYVPAEPETTMGQLLRPLLEKGDLVVVRSQLPLRDGTFGTINNFHDPRVFYVARAHGWVLPHDSGEALLAQCASRGARYYVETGKPATDPGVGAWLAAHARLVVDRPEGRLYALPGPPPA